MYYNICNLQMEKSFFIAVEAGNYDIYTGDVKATFMRGKTVAVKYNVEAFIRAFMFQKLIFKMADFN